MPHTTRPGLRKRPKSPDELIAVAEKTDNKSDATNEANNVSNDNKPLNKSINGTKRVRLLTKKELFDELCEEYIDKRKREKISFIVSFLYVLLNVGFSATCYMRLISFLCLYRTGIRGICF